MEECILLCELCKTIKNSTKKINYFAFHASRCKKVDDIIKLSVMIAIETSYVVSIKQIANNYLSKSYE